MSICNRKSVMKDHFACLPLTTCHHLILPAVLFSGCGRSTYLFSTRFSPCLSDLRFILLQTLCNLPEIPTSCLILINSNKVNQCHPCLWELSLLVWIDIIKKKKQWKKISKLSH